MFKCPNCENEIDSIEIFGAPSVEIHKYKENGEVETYNEIQQTMPTSLFGGIYGRCTHEDCGEELQFDQWADIPKIVKGKPYKIEKGVIILA